jgi:hypothetical protein
VVIAETNGKDEHVFKPDVGVLALSNTESQALTAVEPTFDAESVAMRAFIATDYRENFIEIHVTEPERILVTCIEVLSPSNKRRGTMGWDIYLRKRQGLLLGEANLVEIDLLRGGERFPMLDPWPNSPYAVLVSRRTRAPSCRAWGAHFKRPLPTIPVPLLMPDPDVPLDLQPMVDTIYARSRYYRDIDYTRPLSRPLSDEEARWLGEQLKQRASGPVTPSA